MVNLSDNASQDSLLLKTKLYIPPLRSELVPRPRLIQRLKGGTTRKLTLVSAPAGFGKTTLLCEWIEGLETRDEGFAKAAWISLDREDNEPVRFLTYIVAALRTIPRLREAEFGETTLAMLQSPQPPPIQAILTTLTNEIDTLPRGDQEDRPYILVLDDYHVIEAQQVDETLTFLLDYLPPPPRGLHLVIASRADPSLPLSRLRAGGLLTEIRVTDLRFTHDEVTAFLNQAMGLNLPPEHIVALETRTEGWIAGLQLAALSMQGEHPDHISGLVQSFTGSHRYIIDYLVDEVLEQRPKGTKDFLLQTSILNRLSGPLCDAVRFIETGNSAEENSQAILEALEAANLFIVPLDNERRWYRYHHLFADLLRQRLRRAQPEKIPELHRRASAWYAQNGLTADAVGHALAAKDYVSAARLIEPIGFLIMTRSEWSTLASWLEAMPEDFMHTRPWLCIFRAWMLRRAGRYDAVEELVQYAEKGLGAPDSPVSGNDAQEIRAHIAALRAHAALFKGDTSTAIELAHQAQEHFPSGAMIQGATGLILGTASRMSGDVRGAIKAFGEARSSALAVDNVFLTHIAMWHTGYTLLLHGQLQRAAATYHEALNLASQQGERRFLFAGQPHVYLGEICRERNELDAAETHLLEGIERCQPTRLLDALTDGYVTLARVRLAQGDLHAAIAAFEHAQQLLQVPSPDPLNVMHVGQCQLRLWLAQGDLAAAIDWVQDAGLGVEDELNYLRELEHIQLARVLVARGMAQSGESHLNDALHLLARLLKLAESAGWTGKTIEILVLQALAFQAQNRTKEALMALARALSLGEPEGYVRIFVDEGAPMAELLHQAASCDIAPGYVNRLLDAFKTETKDERPKTVAPSPSGVGSVSFLAEPLSGREMQVLQLLAAGLTNREIAQELTIAISTAKTHLKNIYAKLGVRNRTQAVARARELNLL